MKLMGKMKTNSSPLEPKSRETWNFVFESSIKIQNDMYMGHNGLNISSKVVNLWNNAKKYNRLVPVSSAIILSALFNLT